MKAMERSLFLVAVYTGLPYAQPRRFIKGAFDLMEGETEDFRRLLWSESMLENK